MTQRRLKWCSLDGNGCWDLTPATLTLTDKATNTTMTAKAECVHVVKTTGTRAPRRKGGRRPDVTAFRSLRNGGSFLSLSV